MRVTCGSNMLIDFYFAAVEERDQRAGFRRNVLEVFFQIEFLLLGDDRGKEDRRR